MSKKDAAPAKKPSKAAVAFRGKLPWITVITDAQRNVTVDMAANGFDARNKLVQAHGVEHEAVLCYGPRDWDTVGRDFVSELFAAALKDNEFRQKFVYRFRKR